MSPFGGWGSTLAILFVLIVAAIKALLEDLKRHQEDRSTNASTAHRVNADGVVSLPASLAPQRHVLACYSTVHARTYLLQQH